MEYHSVESTHSTSLYSEVTKVFDNLLSKPQRDFHRRSQIKDLQETKEKLSRELDEANIVLSESHKIVEALMEEYERLKKVSEDQRNHDQVICQKKAELEKEYTLLQKMNSSSHTEELIEKAKLQYKCVRDMTQVRFSLSKVRDDILEGFVFNKITNKITDFSINISESDSEEVREQLLSIMKKTIHPRYCDIPLE